LEVLRALRQSCNTPLLMLSARGEPVDRILGLELGADDYLAKPADPRELVARLRALLRRSAAGSDAPVLDACDPPLEPYSLPLRRRQRCAGTGSRRPAHGHCQPDVLAG